MTPIAFTRVLDTFRQGRTPAVRKAVLHLVGGTEIPLDNWEWLNEGKGGLDVIIVVQVGKRLHFVDVEHISSVSIVAPTTRERITQPRK